MSKERPILFSGPMVRAILEGRKTQTRRVVNVDTLKVVTRGLVRGDYIYSSTKCNGKTEGMIARGGAVSGRATDLSWLGLKPEEFDFCCPYCSGETHILDDHRWMITPEPEQRLWVRETFSNDSCACYEACSCPATWYRADFGGIDKDDHPKWKPSIHMPRAASRITLEITAVRVERLQDISEADARAEGIVDGGCERCGNSEPCGCSNPCPNARDAFCWLWGQINGPDSWLRNPWVWVVEFRHAK